MIDHNSETVYEPWLEPVTKGHSFSEAKIIALLEKLAWLKLGKIAQNRYSIYFRYPDYNISRGGQRLFMFAHSYIA